MTDGPIRCAELVYSCLGARAFEDINSAAVSLVDDLGGLKIETYPIGSDGLQKAEVYSLPGGVTFCVMSNSNPRLYHGLHIKFTIASTLPDISLVQAEDLEARLEGIPKIR